MINGERKIKMSKKKIKKLQEAPKTSTKVLTCYCEHEFQDSQYGKMRRMCNAIANGGYRCTVCGKDVN